MHAESLQFAVGNPCGDVGPSAAAAPAPPDRTPPAYYPHDRYRSQLQGARQRPVGAVYSLETGAQRLLLLLLPHDLSTLPRPVQAAVREAPSPVAFTQARQNMPQLAAPSSKQFESGGIDHKGGRRPEGALHAADHHAAAAQQQALQRSSSEGDAAVSEAQAAHEPSDQRVQKAGPSQQHPTGFVGNDSAAQGTSVQQDAGPSVRPSAGKVAAVAFSPAADYLAMLFPAASCLVVWRLPAAALAHQWGGGGLQPGGGNQPSHAWPCGLIPLAAHGGLPHQSGEDCAAAADASYQVSLTGGRDGHLHGSVRARGRPPISFDVRLV